MAAPLTEPYMPGAKGLALCKPLAIQSRHCQCTHFMDKETEAQESQQFAQGHHASTRSTHPVGSVVTATRAYGTFRHP